MTEATQHTPPRGPYRRIAPLGLALLCLIGGGAYLYEQRAGHTVPEAPSPSPGSHAVALAPAAPSPAAAAAAAQTSAAAPSAAPRVDVVRVDKDGNLVVAGRAKPGETLLIHNGRQALGSVTADASGEWVFLPDQPLSPGAHEIIIAPPGVPESDTARRTEILLGLPGNAAQVAGQSGRQSGSGVTISAPGSPLESGPLVVLSQGSAPPRLLAGPPGSTPGPVGLDVVQYDDEGRIRFTGHAKPGSEVRLYVDNKPVGQARADAAGQWSLTPKAALASGVHSLRADELAPGGRVAARSEVPFSRANLDQALRAGQSIVQPGDCLWTIARHSYGHGIDYTAIFQANRSQIRDPRLIYPGQVFNIPSTAATTAAAPSGPAKP